MAQKAAIKSRIKSINATKKITGAMELIATVKLQKERNHMLKNRDYISVLKDTIINILSGEIDADNNFLKEKSNSKKVIIVFVSDLGLCGGYNINLLKEFEKVINNDDEVIVIGTSQYKWFKDRYKVINDPIASDSITYLDLKKYTDQAIEKYRNNEIGSIVVAYTKFINNVSFEPVVEKVLPCKFDKNEKTNKAEILLEPDANDILNHLIPMYAENNVYSRWLEAKTSEQGSRRFAMQNATDNADELTEELLLAYNQARQAAITQEITEIIGGADAL